tara:strand:+ start:58 stop:708 length:651 start_codon:yes stop_codon:yes gene_type:complete
MITDYHNEYISNPPKFKCTEEFIEEREVKSLGGLWNDSLVDGNNGADGWLSVIETETQGLILEDPIEVKSQIYQTYSKTKNGPSKLMGRGKFGSGSEDIAEKKRSAGEIVYTVGADTEGIIYFKFSYLFADIEERYLETVELYEGKNHGNVDVVLLPWEIHLKDSFQMHYIHPLIEKCMYNGEHKRFTSNLHQFLCEFDRKKLVDPLKEWEEFLRV